MTELLKILIYGLGKCSEEHWATNTEDHDLNIRNEASGQHNYAADEIYDADDEDPNTVSKEPTNVDSINSSEDGMAKTTISGNLGKLIRAIFKKY